MKIAVVAIAVTIVTVMVVECVTCVITQKMNVNVTIAEDVANVTAD
jgi:hypothetical protein